MLDVKNEIVEWFSTNCDIQKSEILENLEKNYLLLGWIDSLKIVSFIIFIEEKFNVRFENDEFENQDFSTIYGLEKIILGKINDKL